jgi:hypothetical protein
MRIQLIVGSLLIVGTAEGCRRQSLRFYGHPDKNKFLLYPDLPPLSLHLFLAVPSLSYQLMSGKEDLSTVHCGDLKGRGISTGDPRQCLRSVSVSSGISGEYGISRLGDSVEVFLRVEDGDGAFTKDEDYLVIKQDPAYCWKFTDSRDCRRMSQAESQVLWASRQK